MLREWKSVRQRPEEGFRRWFTDDDMDLIVWYRDDEIRGFQLCYGKRDVQHALTWLADGTYSHARVDDGESGRMPGPKQTPILVQDGHVDTDELAGRFEAHARNIDDELRQLVVARVKGFSSR
ncbi:MAG: hypothetical protein ACOC1I_07170 [Spirochaetota bacterium]